MFDLFPDVGHLMLDRDLADPFDRDLAHRGARHQAAVPSGADGGTIVRARRALGTRLIALGSALAIDEAPARHSLAR